MTIKFTQINLHHSKGATAIINRSLQLGHTNIALIQEPWTKGKKILGLSNNNWNIFSDDNATRPRVCICIRKHINSIKLIEFCNQDLVAVKISINIGDLAAEVVIASAYFPYDVNISPPSNSFIGLVEYCERLNLLLLVGCDANAHHTVWGSTNVNWRGEALLEYISGTNLEILNRGHDHTFVTSRRQETIDLTLASLAVASSVKNWRVGKDDSLSDHRSITFCIQSEKPAPATFRNARSTNWDLYGDRLVSLANEWNIGAVDSVAEIEKLASSMERSIIASYEYACPLRRFSNSKEVPWWSSELKRLRKQVRRQLRKALRTDIVEDWDLYSEKQRQYKALIRSSKIATWRKFCNEVEGMRPSARIHKTLSKDVSFKPDALEISEGIYTTSKTETAKHLLSIHFPGCIIQNYDDINPTNEDLLEATLADWKLAEVIVVKEKLKWAINSFAPFKTPGVDKIFPALLQKAVDILMSPLQKLLTACIALGYIPKGWRESNVVFIPKPGRASYGLAKSFRPISLTSFLLKTLERLIDWYVRDTCLIKYPIHTNQHAYQKGKSVETSLTYLVSKIEKALDQKDYAFCTFMDIEGAFDRTSLPAILTALMKHGVPATVIRLIMFMLRHRVVSTELDSEKVTVSVGRGCPQGGILSPLLWLLVADELIQLLNSKGYFTLGYADDLVIIIVGKFLKTLTELTQSALLLVEAWCRRKELNVNPSKSEAIIFTRKTQVETVEMPCLFDQQIKKSNQVKYLGVILDSKMTWKPHVELKLRTANAILWQCRKAYGKTWGLSPLVLNWIYRVIVRPMFSFAAVVWWPRIQLGITKNSMNHLQRTALISMTGAMKTTPTAALEILVGLEPLHIYVEKVARTTIMRLSYQDQLQVNFKNLGHREIQKTMELENSIYGMPSDLTIASFSTTADFRVLLTNREDWFGETATWPPANGILCFTDGSLTERSAGYGFYCERLNLKKFGALGSFATVFQSEIFAILDFITCAEVAQFENEDIFICSDSQAALKALSQPVVSSKLVHECRSILRRVGMRNRVTLLWVPSHSGIEGNEIADGLAKAGSECIFIGPEPVLGISFATTRRFIEDWSNSSHKTYWNAKRDCRQSKYLLKSPLTPIISKAVLCLDRADLRLFVGIITGHCGLNSHLFKMRLKVSGVCEQCETRDLETVEHFLCKCPAFSALRHRIFGCHYMGIENLSIVEYKLLRAFIIDSNRFSQ